MNEDMLPEILARLARCEVDLSEVRRLLIVMQAEAVTARVLAQRVADPHRRLAARDAWVERDG